MPQFRFLCAKISNIRGAGRNLNGNTLHDLEAIAFDPNDLPRVIRNQPDLVQPKIRQDLRADSIVTEIGLEPEL